MQEALRFRTAADIEVPVDLMDANQCLDAAVEADKIIAAAQAWRIRILARFGSLRPPERRGVILGDGAREELSIELGITPNAALNQIAQAEDLVERLPATVTALEAGEIDLRRAQAMLEVTDVLSAEHAQKVERKVLVNGKRTNHSRFRQAIRYHTINTNPKAAEVQRQKAKEHRDVTYMDGLDGMGHITADLTADQARAAHDMIDTLARRAKTPDRSLGQCRADVFMDLVLGKDMKRPHIQINVTVPMTTLLGLNEHPGELSGYGPITAEHARELAEHAVWRRVITDSIGHVIEASRKRYASPALRDFLQLRDRTCRFPGCPTPAERCEIDHTIRHQHHGPNAPDNTTALCKHHNLMRERANWRLTQPTPGTLTFTSPEGRTYTTTPEPYLEPTAA